MYFFFNGKTLKTKDKNGFTLKGGGSKKKYTSQESS